MGTLEIRSLSRIRDGVLVFDEVSFTVPDGHVTAIVGPALSGKTSLLRVIAGLERSDGGDVLLDDQSLLRLPPERRRLGFLFDNLALFEEKTVRENVMFGLRMQRRSRVDRLRRTDELLAALGLTERAHEKPRDLSPGERKRVAFARAVAPGPALLLLDEPTTGVGEVEQEEWRQELAQALRALHVTTLIATADLRDAVTLADDLVLLAEGQVFQAGTVSRVLQGPASIEAALLAGYVRLVRGDVAEGFVVEQGVGSITFPAGFPLRQHAVVMAHPTALFGVPAGSGLGSGVSGALIRARPDGPAYVVEVQLNDRSVALRWEWDLTPPPAGTVIEVAVRPGTLRFFNDTPAPRVRGTDAPARDTERYATLATRSDGETDTPSWLTPPVPASGEAPATAGRAAKGETPGPDPQPEVARSTEYADNPTRDPTSEGNERVRPMPRPDGRAHDPPRKSSGESLRPEASAGEPVRTRPSRPTPPQLEVLEDLPQGAPITSPPPSRQSLQSRHAGMPLD